MKIKYITSSMVCLFILAMVLPSMASSTRGNSDVCDPNIIGQIQQGKSSKADVKQLIGDPAKYVKKSLEICKKI